MHFLFSLNRGKSFAYFIDKAEVHGWWSSKHSFLVLLIFIRCSSFSLCRLLNQLCLPYAADALNLCITMVSFAVWVFFNNFSKLIIYDLQALDAAFNHDLDQQQKSSKSGNKPNGFWAENASHNDWTQLLLEREGRRAISSRRTVVRVTGPCSWRSTPGGLILPCNFIYSYVEQITYCKCQFCNASRHVPVRRLLSLPGCFKIESTFCLWMTCLFTLHPCGCNVQMILQKQFKEMTVMSYISAIRCCGTLFCPNICYAFGMSTVCNVQLPSFISSTNMLVQNFLFLLIFTSCT